MCGIAGLLGIGDRFDLARMTRIMSHRGPDGEGMIWWDKACAGLGHRRLAIIDISESGYQPMVDATGDRWITFNGEIYNYRELKEELSAKGHSFRTQSDTEVLLVAYREWGADCLDHLNGMFAFAIYEPGSGRLFAARDRLGVKPLYYYWRPGLFVFASEVKAILASGQVPKEPDYAALHTPTRFQIAPATGFANIRKLPAGHCLSYDGKQAPEIRRYWELRPTEQNGNRTQDTLDQLDALLEDSVRMQMVADVPVGIMLSGGLDSSLISSYARKLNPGRLESFTIRFSPSDQSMEKMPDDSVYARKLADDFGFQHHEFTVQSDIRELFPRMVWHLDEPLADSATINTFILSEAARRSGITVLLNGMGGDEIFGGYRKQKACLYANLYQFVPAFMRQGLQRYVSGLPVVTAHQGNRRIRWLKRFVSFADLPPYERYLASDQSYSVAQFGKAFVNKSDYASTPFYQLQQKRFCDPAISYLTAMCCTDTDVFLPAHNLLYSDKASMAAGVEGRPPLTDHRLAEFMFRLPPSFRMSRGIQKYAMKRVASRHLPDEFVYRPKAPFAAPLRAWMHGPLKSLADEYLSDTSIRHRGLYRPDFVADLIANERSGLEDNAFWIWQLLTVEIWFRTFFDSALPETDIRSMSWTHSNDDVYESAWSRPA